MEPEATGIDHKTTKTSYRVELVPSLCVVQFHMRAGKHPREGNVGRSESAWGSGQERGWVSNEGSEGEIHDLFHKAGTDFTSAPKRG